VTIPDWRTDMISLRDQVVMEPFGQELYEALAPMTYADRKQGWALAHYTRAIALMFEDVEKLIRNSEWGDAMDVDTVWEEGIPWLGQFIGIRLPEPWPVERQRDWIHNKLNWKRGTIEGIKETVGVLLTGSKTVRIDERVGSAYHIIVSTYAQETPADTTRIINAINASKPGGITFEYQVVPGQLWEDVVLDGTWAEVAAEYTDWHDVEVSTPTPG